MVPFGELCAWEMPDAARTWMRDLGKTSAGRLWVWRASGDRGMGSPVEGTLEPR